MYKRQIKNIKGKRKKEVIFFLEVYTTCTKRHLVIQLVPLCGLSTLIKDVSFLFLILSEMIKDISISL